MTALDRVKAWQPGVPGIHEVFHAHFTEHAYPLHTHDTWTLLIVDDGAVRYDLDHREHGALRSMVTLLPPQVAHDGRPARTGGFRKRVLYLDPEVFGTELIGRAVDQPDFTDPQLRLRIDQLHTVLGDPSAQLHAESRLALISDRLNWHLLGHPDRSRQPTERPVAVALRELLDEHLLDGVDLSEAARWLGVSTAHLIRSFTSTYGLPPHRYLTGRRVERARGLLLAGMPIAEVAATAGFYDQPHLTRQLRQMIGTTPAAYRRVAV